RRDGTPRRHDGTPTTRRDATKTRRTRRSVCTRWSSCLRVFVADPHAADPAVDVRVVQCAPFSANCSAPRRGPHLGPAADEAGGEAVIPAAFEYLRASSVDEAVAHLQQHGGDARVLAGGQSLIPAMCFRLARPGVLVDINHVRELNYLRTNNGTVEIGATARDADVERAPWIGDRRWTLLRDASRVVADPGVRQVGTVVGSLCHNDPAGDRPAVCP